MTSNISPTQLSTVTIEWGSLCEVWFLRGAYASLRSVGFAYAAMDKGKINEL